MNISDYLSSGKKYKQIFYFSMIIITGAFFALMYVTNGFVARGLFYQNSTNSFMDFFNSMLYNLSNPYENQVFYPPFACMMYKLFLMMVPESTINSVISNITTNSYTASVKLKQDFLFPFILYSIITICFLFVALMTAKDGKKLEKYTFTVLMFLSAPMLFMFERANNIIIVLSLLLLFISWYDSESKLKRELSIIFLALAVAIKIYPVLFCALLLKKKRIVDILKVFAYTLVLTIVPLLIFYGGIGSIADMFNNLTSYGNNTGLSVGTQLNFGKCIIFPIYNTGLSNETLLTISSVAKYLICIPAAIGAIFSRKPWIQTALCACIVYGYQDTCATYLLVLFVLPLILFLDKENEKSIFNYIILGLFIIILGFLPAMIPYNGTFSRMIGTKVTSYAILVMTFMLTASGISDFWKGIKNLAKK